MASGYNWRSARRRVDEHRELAAQRALTVFTVETDDRRIVLGTDDWVDAQAAAIYRGRGPLLYVRGTHPSHEWDAQAPRRCVKCQGWDNGSYGSQAPCGYDFGGASLVSAIERELESRRG
jgi:hypothetical protein